MKGRLKVEIKVPVKVLIARILIFTFVLVWDMSFLLVGLLLLSPLIIYIEGLDIASWLVRILVSWYMLTLVILSVYVALKAFLVVGRWGKSDEE